MSSRIEASPLPIPSSSSKDTLVFDRRSFIHRAVGGAVGGVVTGSFAIHLVKRSLHQGEQVETLKELEAQPDYHKDPVREGGITARREEHELMRSADEFAAVQVAGISTLSFGVTAYEIVKFFGDNISGFLKGKNL